MIKKQAIMNINLREMKGREIRADLGSIRRITSDAYKVKSQSSDKYYNVEHTPIGWKCNCPDHKYRGSKCKHIWAVESSQGIKKQVKKNVVLEPIVITGCPCYHSRNIKKAGIRHNKSGDLQRYECKDCSKLFSINIGFEKMKHNPKAVTTAMQLYFIGESLRSTQKSLKLIGVNVSHQTVANWISKHIAIMKNYVDNIKPNVSSTWRADEIYIKVRGDMKYLFALMDDETRY